MLCTMFLCMKLYKIGLQVHLSGKKKNLVIPENIKHERNTLAFLATFYIHIAYKANKIL